MKTCYGYSPCYACTPVTIANTVQMAVAEGYVLQQENPLRALRIKVPRPAVVKARQKRKKEPDDPEPPDQMGIAGSLGDNAVKYPLKTLLLRRNNHDLLTMLSVVDEILR